MVFYVKDGASVTQVMKLFFKSYRGYLIFTFFIAWLSAINTSLAQVRKVDLAPWIQEIGTPAPSRDVAHVSLHIDRYGHLFLGRENGLIIQEKNRHVRLPMNGPVFVTGDQSDTLIYTTPGDVGLLLADRENGYHAVSRAYWIPASIRNFTPKGIVKYGDIIFISSERGIYSFRRGACQLHDPGAAPRFIRIENDTVYLRLENNELWIWNGTGFEKNSDRGMGIVPLKILADGAGPARDPLAVFPLQDGNVLVQDSMEGLIVLNRSGQVVNRLETPDGLPEMEIRQILVRDGH